MDVCDNADEIIAFLSSVWPALAHVGVVPLLGGVFKVCQHFSHSRSGLVDVSSQKARFGVGSAPWWCPQRHPSIAHSHNLGEELVPLCHVSEGDGVDGVEWATESGSDSDKGYRGPRYWYP
jgi:hypothetical protein